MRSAHSRPVTVGLATGLFVLASGVTGTAMAATSPSTTATPSSSSSGTASATTKASASPSASSSPSADVSKASASPSATASSTPSTAKATTSATPTPTASSTKSATPSPTASATSTAKPAADIAVTASATSAEPGATILFRISAYTNLTASATGKVTSAVAPSKTTPAFAAPVFTVDNCTSTSGTTCTLTVPTAKPSQPQVETQITVPKTAPAGETVKYSATVTVTDGSTTLTETVDAPTITIKAAASASASSSAKKKNSAAPGSSTSPSTPSSAGATVNIPGLSGTTENVGAALPLGALPAVAGISTTIPAGNASNLFPQISPSASPSPAAGTQAAVPAKAEPVADSSRIPLSLGSSEFGAQIIGLIVLLLGVAAAVTRLSLRKTRPNSNK